MKQRAPLYFHVRCMVYTATESGDATGEFQTLLDPEGDPETNNGYQIPLAFHDEREAQIVAFNTAMIRQTHTQVHAIRSNRHGGLVGECIHEYNPKMSEEEIAALGFGVLDHTVPEVDPHAGKEPLRLPGLH